MSDTLVQSVKKAAAILDILIFEDEERSGIGLFELARMLDLKPNTLHNLLKTLIACGYVEQRTDSKYASGPKCLQIGKLNNGKSIVDKVTPVLQKTCEAIEESVIFSVLINGNRKPLVHIGYNHPIKIDVESIEERNLYEKNTGRVLTAFADDYNFSLIKNNWGYPGEKWDGIKDDASFEQVREEVRKNGYIVCLTSNDTIVSFSVPVFDSNKKLIGAIGSYAPVFRCNEGKQKIILDGLRQAAALVKEKSINN